MSYNWKITRKEEYDLDDLMTPAKFLADQWCSVAPEIDIPVGEPADLVFRDIKDMQDLADNWRKEADVEMMDSSYFDMYFRPKALCLKFDNQEALDIFRVHKDPFGVKEVIFNNPATVVYWADGTKTVVTDMDNMVDGKPKACEGYSRETGLALCYMKKALGNKGNYNNAFRKWIKED